MAMTADMVIRNGTLVDGSDDPAFQGDIAIKDGLIIAVGDRTGTGRLDITGDKEFDASGCLVTPGWVDAHTHMDGQVTWVRPQPRLCTPYFAVTRAKAPRVRVH